MSNNRRRPKGSGSIYKRKDGRVVGEYEVNGKKRYIYGRTRQEVAARLAKPIAERDSGYDAGSITVGEYLDRWPAAIENTLRLRSFKRYEESTRIHIKPTLGKVRLSRLDPFQLQGLYRAKLGSGLSPRTVQIIHATMHKALKQALKWRLIPYNGCSCRTTTSAQIRDKAAQYWTGEKATDRGERNRAVRPLRAGNHYGDAPG
jgi:integrase